MARGRPRKSNAGASVAGKPKKRPTTRSQHSENPPIVQDSADDLGTDLAAAPSSGTRRSSSFLGVFPPSRLSHSAHMEIDNSSESRASGSRLSPALSDKDSSEEANTPVTNLTTPAESINGSKGVNMARSRGSSRGKRKRTSPEESTPAGTGLHESADAQLAYALQQEEYEEPGSKRHKKEIPSRAMPSDESDLSSVPAELDDSEEDEPLANTRRKQKAATTERKKTSGSKRKTPQRTSGARKARNAAREKISKRSANLGESSEESLSDFVNDSEASAASSVQFFSGDSVDEESEESEVDVGTTQARENFAEWRRQRASHSRMRRAEKERLKLEKSHPEILTMWDDLANTPRVTPVQAEQPNSITRKLKGFQLEGLDWMINQEKSRWKGGLLGDEMGMGKTIQAVSLIMSDYPQKEPTLVVVPPVALMQWTNEIQDYTDGKLKVLVYHGTNSKAKQMSVKELKTYNVILISYSGLESIYRKETKGWSRQDKIVKEDSAIHAIHFHRLMLDEAHSIKSRTTGVAKACVALQGTYKWCLSGTPVQNRIGEFFSLLRFLDCSPYANYFCKSCSCSRIHWNVTPDYRCVDCKHRSLDHVSVFNQEILNPISTSESRETRKAAYKKLNLLTDHVMLRRLKRDQTSSMELPPKEIIVHNEFFGEIERDFASSIMTNTSRKFDTYVSRGVMLNNYANIFGLIMQMRQVADHPDLLLKKHAEAGQNVLVCNICDEPCEDGIRSRCRHEFCRSCAKDYINTCEASGATADCPRCHIALSIDFDQPELEQDEEHVKKSSIINRIKMENWTSSTKIETLVYDLWKLRSKKQTTKSIVFSQFTSMLQLIEWRLRRAGFNTVMLDGSMTPQQRQKSIEYFMNNSDVEVFLVSLKAGGVALNLTEASRVFIVDPWWNPAAEWQSADRCHRIGQRRPCVITRLCIEDSVESRIVMLQEKKAALINSTVNKDEVSLDKLSPEDMQFLFRGS